jgi:tRNA pseudouridine55 synthase
MTSAKRIAPSPFEGGDAGVSSRTATSPQRGSGLQAGASLDVGWDGGELRPKPQTLSTPTPTLPLQGGGRKTPRRAVHGVLLLDKPLGWTSNDALQKTKGILRAEKGGHTGTLDPLATGLLPLCFGAATKFAQVSLDADKRYLATLRLGQTTSTADGEGALLSDVEVKVTPEQIDAALAAHTGPLMQLPPMHSALKHEGRALYEYARQGIEIERPRRAVTIHSITVVSWPSFPESPLLTIDVRCSKGTYIRTLAEDIGAALGCGAHLSALRRTGSGALSIEQAVTLEAFEAMDDNQRSACLLTPEVLLTDWPAVALDADEASRFLTGLRRRVARPDTPAVRVYGPPPTSRVGPSFLGSAHITGGELIADRLLSPPEVQALAA